MLHYSLRTQFRILFSTFAVYGQNNLRHESMRPVNTLRNMMVLMAAELFSYPLQTFETRFIIAHLKKEYRTIRIKSFKNIENIEYLKSLYKGFFGALLLSGFNGFWITTALSENDSLSAFFQTSITATLFYPVTTAVRRLQGQSEEIGMIPPRYANVRHALKLIYNEEGFKGLYRGFLANTAAIVLAFTLLRHLRLANKSGK